MADAQGRTSVFPIMQRVLIIQTQMKRYRVPFFVGLHQLLEADGIQLRIVYSLPSASESAKGDDVPLPNRFSTCVPCYWIARGRLIYQPLVNEIERADLVIAEHANKLIINHPLLLSCVFGLKRFGLWGLGNNKQLNRSRLAEWYNGITLKWVDSYFAYTSSVAQEVAALGVSKERITVVQNAIDTREFRAEIASIKDSELNSSRRRLGIEPDASIGLFCGTLDPVKGVSFLIDCCKLIRRRVPGFHLVLIGGGDDQRTIESLVRDLPWVHAVGPQFGREKALFFKLSDVFLLPGRVGLVILDSFAASLPLLTVRTPIHGPEIEYLEQGVNGFMVERDVNIYSDVAIRLLNDRDSLQRLKEGASHSGARFTIDAMVHNFRSGILRCLQSNQ
jgi:glycosyltransferase involved in cell wall biosynthesis